MGLTCKQDDLSFVRNILLSHNNLDWKDRYHNLQQSPNLRQGLPYILDLNCFDYYFRDYYMFRHQAAQDHPVLHRYLDLEAQ